MQRTRASCVSHWLDFHRGVSYVDVGAPCFAPFAKRGSFCLRLTLSSPSPAKSRDLHFAFRFSDLLAAASVGLCEDVEASCMRKSSSGLRARPQPWPYAEERILRRTLNPQFPRKCYCRVLRIILATWRSAGRSPGSSTPNLPLHSVYQILPCASCPMNRGMPSFLGRGYSVNCSVCGLNRSMWLPS